ncbi:peptidoglycan DD-metalloendopeptidase family protein [Candidatus Peregrinibacteria bacterium]|nr:peptidoglycan DD-metalloendopeptidase family protein [Candidatus Peregrinibacteria bacterium]
MMHTPRHWLQIRIRCLCIGLGFLGAVLPPYIPPSAVALQDMLIETPQFLLVEEGFLMKPSSLTRQGARRAYAEGIIHTVGEGDSIERIAERYGIAADTIRWTNVLSNKGINPGDELLILPVDGVMHTVHRGQTLIQIAELYSVPARDIVSQNKLKDGLILIGQELIIPGGRPVIVASAKTVDNKKTSGGTSTKGIPVTEVSPTAGVLQKPCNNCTYTQYFHPGHYAVDMQTKGGGPVFVAEDGVVIRAEEGWNGGYGNVIEVDHGNGLTTLYAHNKEHFVKIGDRIKRGQVIAWMGNTGRTYGQTGIHVHFEVHVNGVKRNPLLYLD